jgi:hypothetical protein
MGCHSMQPNNTETKKLRTLQLCIGMREPFEMVKSCQSGESAVTKRKQSKAHSDSRLKTKCRLFRF